MQKPSTHTRHVVLDDQQVGRGREHVELLAVVESFTCAMRCSTFGSLRPADAGERLDRAHCETVRRDAPGHVVEQRSQPADVGMQHDAGAGHAVGPGVDDRYVDRVARSVRARPRRRLGFLQVATSSSRP